MEDALREFLFLILKILKVVLDELRNELDISLKKTKLNRTCNTIRISRTVLTCKN